MTAKLYELASPLLFTRVETEEREEIDLDKIGELSTTLNKGKVISLNVNESGQVVCRYIQRHRPFYQFWKRGPSQKESLENVQPILNSLQTNPRIRNSHDILRVFSSFISEIKEKAPIPLTEQQNLAELEKEIFAARLGVPAKSFGFPEFYKFAKGNFLHRYGILYPGCYGSNSEGEPWFKVEEANGELKQLNWSEFSTRLAPPDSPKLNDADAIPVDSNGYLLKHRIMAGRLVAWDYVNWGGAEGAASVPYKDEGNPPPWGKRFLLEVSTCSNQIHPRFTFDHTWFLLKTDEGKVFSYGFYRPHKQGLEYNNYPLNTKQGFWQSPDISDITVDEDKIDRIPFKITAEDFKNLKQWIEDVQGTDFDLYNLINKNCSDKVEVILHKLGIQIEARLTQVDNFLPTRIGYINNKRDIDECVERVEKRSLIHRIIEVGINCIGAFCLGGMKVRKDVKIVSAKPFMSKISDIFKSNLAVMKHPFLVYLWGKDIKKLRKEKEALLLADLAKKNEELSLLEGQEASVDNPEKIQKIKEAIQVLEIDVEENEFGVPEKYKIPTKPYYSENGPITES
ncbi:MAG: hypothetical protein ACI9S8_002465 [Chlamydiales bacterium]|jgi:hypothetical protein